MNSLELSIVMPCLNEARTLERCLAKARAFLKDNNVQGEIIVADNGSTDASRQIAQDGGARIIDVPARGYGSALLGGIAAAEGQYVIMGDADDSYDFSMLMPFLEKLREGYDLVMGNRFRGGIRPGAMPFLHRYLGNPMLSLVGNLFFRSPVRDYHCGLRGFRTEAIRRLNLRTTGMEFASEIVVSAILHKLRVTEVPTILYPDGRGRPPHLRTWRDGWRHLRFLLLLSPRWLFLYPGVLATVLGTAFGILLLSGQLLVFDVHTLLYCGVMVILGINAISFALFAEFFAVQSGLLPQTMLLRKISRLASLEGGILAGGIILTIGIGLSAYAVYLWSKHGFSNLDPQQMLRLVIPAVTLIFVGFHTVLSSFLLSILQIPRRSSSDITEEISSR